jgi:hypothetical protein
MMGINTLCDSCQQSSIFEVKAVLISLNEIHDGGHQIFFRPFSFLYPKI